MLIRNIIDSDVAEYYHMFNVLDDETDFIRNGRGERII